MKSRIPANFLGRFKILLRQKASVLFFEAEQFTRFKGLPAFRSKSSLAWLQNQCSSCGLSSPIGAKLASSLHRKSFISAKLNQYAL